MLFKGKLVNLREVREEDLELATGYLNDMELLLVLDDDAPAFTSKDKQKQWYEEYLKKKDPYEGVDFAIETKEGKYLGTCSAYHINKKNRIAETGIFIGDKEYLGKGYGTEAMQLLLEYLFMELNINRVELGVFSFNERAIKSYEKCGFKLEAVSREAIYRYGSYQDLTIMSMLKEEYLEKYKVIAG